MNPEIPLIIKDERGILFYSNEGFNRPIKQINLPPFHKLYLEKGTLGKLKHPISYKKIPNRRPIRKLKKNPENFKVIYSENPHKCTVDWSREMMIFDKSFLEKSIPENVWILFHEYGHRYFNRTTEDEMSCDIFAANKMLEVGYNPEQIGRAILGTISNRNIERKRNLILNLIERK